MEFDAVFTAKKERSKEDFLRLVLINIASSSESPIDTVKAKFGDVEERIREAILCEAHVETDYTASIGYDRTETYWTKEKKYDSETKQYYYVDVEKTRIVTDWQPFSSHISGDKTCIAFNEDDCCMYGLSQNDLLADVVKSIRKDNIVPKGEAEVSFSGLDTVKNNCASSLALDIQFPGDKHKDANYKSDVTVSSLSCYKIPCYEVDYTYNGKKYHVSGFACGNPNIDAELPPNDVNIEEQAKEETKKSKTMKMGAWIGFAGLFVFACIMCKIGVYWTWVFPLVALIASVVLHIKNDKEYAAKIHSLTNDRASMKLSVLKDALSSYGYSSLTESESGLFDFKHDADCTVFKQQKKSKLKLLTILGSVATAILIIVSFVWGAKAANAELHSPKQLDLTVVSKTQEYKSNVSPYINGCYYIYLDYSIEAKKLGVQDMKVIVYVSDKNGNELGSISSSLSYMNLDSGSKKTFTTEWKDNQPEENNNTFFITMYNANFNDLVFTYEFDYIHFDDGQYYHGEN